MILRNGDRVTGEIQLLEYGILNYKTDNMGTIQVEWDVVDQLISKEKYEIELIDGTTYFGSLVEVLTGTSIGIGDDSTLVAVVYSATVVRITPIKDLFWARLNGNISLGLNYKKATELGELNFDSDIKYRGIEYETSFKLSTIVTSQKDQDPSRRTDLNGSIIKYLESRWFISGVLGLSQNTELGLDLRVFTGAGYGRLLISTNHNRLYALAGLQVNREWTKESTDDSYNLEAALTSSFSIFVYDTPKTDFTTTISILPNLTTKGRIRIDFDSKLKREIIKDLTVNFTVFWNYDSKPPEGSVSKSDYGVTFGFGYSI